MAHIKFKDSEEMLKAAVLPMQPHIVRVTTDAEPVLTGFTHYLDENGKYALDNGEYEEYTTLYRQGEGWYELSNDGSVYEVATSTPSDAENYVPTLEEVKANRISAMNVAQQAAIQNGVSVTLSDGTVEHFTLTDHDQTSLMGLQTQVLAGVEQIPWHTSDSTEHCKYYSNADMALITKTAMQYVTYHVTYFRDLRIYINALETSEEVKAVIYGCDIPEEYQSEPLKDMLAQMQ